MAFWAGFSFPFHIVMAKIALSFGRPSVNEDTACYRGNGPSPWQHGHLERQVRNSEVIFSLCPPIGPSLKCLSRTE